MSTYSSSLRVELITSGDQPGQWGNTTNSNFNYIFDKAIAGALSVTTTSLDHVLTYLDGPTPTDQLNQSVYAILKLDTTTGAAFNVFAPPVPKQYIIWNTSSTHAVTIYNSNVYGSTTAAGAGVTIPAGARVLVASDGTAFYGISTVSSISFGTTGLTPNSATSGAVTVAGTLNVANGGTGVMTSTGTGSVVLSDNPSFGTDVTVNSLRVGTGNSNDPTNTAFGFDALDSYTTGGNNVAIGIAALKYGASLDRNVAIGPSSMLYVDGGSYNVAVGYQSLTGIPLATTASYNVAIGDNAMNNTTTGSYNTVVGNSSGVQVAAGNYNTLVGYKAGEIVDTNYNTFIGVNSGKDMGTGSKNTILGSFTGNQGGLDIRFSSNYIVLSDGDGNPRAYWNGANATFNGGLTLTNYLRTAVGSVSSAATITPTSDTANQYNVTALATNATFAAPSGTPADGQKLLLRIKDNGSARTLTWNAIYRAIGVTLPTTTVATKTTYVGCVYNTADVKWDVVAITTQA